MDHRISPANGHNRISCKQVYSSSNLAGVTITYFDDNEDIDDYVKSSDYEDSPKLCVAVVFEIYDSR